MKTGIGSGDRIVTRAGGRAGQVLEWLGEGTQGTVHAAEVDGHRLALKWYHRAAATPEQRQLLESILASGTPDGAFLWPLDLVEMPGRAGFGYLMPMRPEGFVPFTALMTRSAEVGFEAAAEAGLRLAHAFLQLHTRGFCYRDLSFGNLFLAPASGDIRIADNDNIQPDGEAVRAGVLGTPRFMAPELVRGEAEPGTPADLYSLAVVLFYLLMLHHPLEGRREAAIHSLDLPAMEELYGHKPVFIFDPADSSNRPLADLHGNALTFWPMYPEFIHALFLRSFGEGLMDGARRVRETEWRQAMGELKDLTRACPSCGAGMVHAEPFAARIERCWACGQRPARPLGLRLGRRVVLLETGRRLARRSIEADWGRPAEDPFAEVTLHPERPEVPGLTNLSGAAWRCFPAGNAKELVLPPGRTLALRPGTVFHWREAAQVCIV